MEDYKLDYDRQGRARSVRLDLPKFTVIGATTRTGALTARCAIVLGFSQA